MHGPLNGVMVVDLTRVLSGPFCTMVLAELGARVIKVERPGGEDSRNFGPFIKGKSAYFMSLNREKWSLELDLKAEEGKARFWELLEKADVLAENFRPGTMDKLGLGWDVLKERFPKLIYMALSGFGRTGPWAGKPAYDLVAQAMGGIMSLNGPGPGSPTRVGAGIGDIAAGLYASTGISAALYRREKTGMGMLIDVSMLDSQVAILENALVRAHATGRAPEPIGSRHPSITPFDVFMASDGPLVIAVGNDSLFETFCRTLGREDMLQDPRFATNGKRTENHQAMKEELEKILARGDAEYWLSVFDRAGVPCGPINNVLQVMEHPQVKARNMVVTTDDPIAGPTPMAGNPIKMSAYADPVDREPAPELDRDRLAVLGKAAP